jgi:hypothetical protein
MRAETDTWDTRLLMLSPKEQRQWWLDELKRREPHGMAVNCRHMPSLSRTPILRKLIEDGHILRVREYRSRMCNRTVLFLPKPTPAV